MRDPLTGGPLSVRTGWIRDAEVSGFGAAVAQLSEASLLWNIATPLDNQDSTTAN